MKALLVIAVLAATAHAQEAQLSPPSARPLADPPPLDGTRLAGEAAVGLVAGGGGGALGLTLGIIAACNTGRCTWEGDRWLDGGLATATLVGAIGAGIGVWGMGSIGDQHGSLAWSVGGAVLGGGSVALAAVALDRDGRNPGIDMLAVVGGWIGGAMLGFNLTRTRRAPRWLPAISRVHDATTVGLGGRF